MVEAAEMRGVTERTFRRGCVRYEAEGLEGACWIDGSGAPPAGPGWWTSWS